ncbi:UNVERIFIED_CONTAM: hypothetical protein K2H54_067279 [Gekko kuhli]
MVDMGVPDHNANVTRKLPSGSYLPPVYKGCQETGHLKGPQKPTMTRMSCLRPRRRRRRRAVAMEARDVSGAEEEADVPGPSGEPQEPVEQQPEVCMVLQTTPEASAADVSASEHEGPTRSPVMQPVDAPPAAAAGGERPVPATDMSGPTAAEEPTVQSLAAQLAGHVAQTDRRFDRILYLLDLQQKAFRRLNRDVSQLRHTLGLPPAATPTDSEGPCSDGGTTARGDLPLASPIMASAGPPVQSAPTAPPGAGPSTSHDM